MKSMNHLNKVLLVSLIALPFTSSESLAVWGWNGKQVKPSLISRAYNNTSRACGSACNTVATQTNKVASTVATQARQHPVVARCIGGLAGTALVGVVAKKLYNNLPTIKSKAKACGSYLSSGVKKAYNSCVSVTKACGSYIKNHKRASGLVAGTAGAGLLALDFWKKPMRGNPILVAMAKGLLAGLNSYKKPVAGLGIAATAVTGLGWGGSRLVGKYRSGVAAKPAETPVSAEKLAAKKQVENSDSTLLQQVASQQQAQSQSSNGHYVQIGCVKHNTLTCTCAMPQCIAARKK